MTIKENRKPWNGMIKETNHNRLLKIMYALNPDRIDKNEPPYNQYDIIDMLIEKEAKHLKIK